VPAARPARVADLTDGSRVPVEFKRPDYPSPGGHTPPSIGVAAAEHAPVIEHTHTRVSKYDNYSFELDRNDIDWSAQDRSRSLDKPIPAYVRVTITPTK
jgi:hypothetical protein